MKSPSIKPYIIHRCNARQAKMKTMPTFPANSCRTDGILLYLWEQPLWCIINAWCDYQKHIVQPAFLSRISQTNKRPRTPRFPAGDTRHPRRGHTASSSGTHGILVGDTRGARRGLTRPSSGTNDNGLSFNSLQRRFAKEGRRHREGGLYDFF